MTNQIIKSIDNIKVSDELKNRIYENILEKAEKSKKQPVQKKNKVLKFVSYATAAALAIGAFGLYYNVKNTPNTLTIENIDEKSSMQITEITPFTYLDELIYLNIIPDTIELYSYELNETTLSLYFNSSLQTETNIIQNTEYITSIAEYYLTVINDLENVNIYSDGELVTLNGIELTSEYINSVLN